MKLFVESTDPKQPAISHQRSWVQLCKSRMLVHGPLYIFTDGSSLGSFAAVLVRKSDVGAAMPIWEGSGFQKMTSTRNVGAELNGAILGLEQVPVAGDAVVLVYDYFGIGAWLTDNWRIKDAEVAEKVAKLKKIINQKKLGVRYIHHCGHATDDSDFTRWNCRADTLATEEASRVRAPE